MTFATYVLNAVRNRTVKARPPDLTIPHYMFRWHVIPRNKLFNIYFHMFVGEEHRETPHNHPWHNLTWVLKGEYVEYITGRGKKHRKEGDLVFRNPTTIHSVHVVCVPTYTLFFTGPKLWSWGFLQQNGKIKTFREDSSDS